MGKPEELNSRSQQVCPDEKRPKGRGRDTQYELEGHRGHRRGRGGEGER